MFVSEYWRFVLVCEWILDVCQWMLEVCSCL